MPRPCPYRLLPVFIFFVTTFFVTIPSAKAAISSCTANLHTSSTTGGSTSNVLLSISNNDPSNTAKWIKVTSPSSNFSIDSGLDNYGWTNSDDLPVSTTIFGGDLISTASMDMVVKISAVNSECAPQSWLVQISDDPNGNSPTNCQGSLDMSITPPETPTITITDLTAANTSDTSVTFTWTTDIPSNSQSNYGLTSEYGMSVSDLTQTTKHSLTLSSLLANTTYHVDISSANQDGISNDTGDFTFTTSSSSPGVTTTIVIPTPTNTPIPTPTPIPDITPPKISVSTNFSKPYYPAPKITGVASDNKSISQIQYSLTSDSNWIPVDAFTPGAKINFSFTPADLEDGSYPIRIKGTDPSGNIGYSATTTLVIDRLPPQVSLGIISQGPQILTPNSSGAFTTLVGLPLQLSCLTSGGPTDILVSNPDTPLTHLTSQSQTDFWTGVFIPTTSGDYPLTAKSIDGAGNQTTQVLPKLNVLPAGQVIGAAAEVSVYVFDTTTQKFLLWDGLPYGIKNPQTTDSSGNYYYILPSGRYYLEARAPKFHSNRTTIFNLTSSTPVNPIIKLAPSTVLHLGTLNMALPNFSPDTTQYSPTIDTTSVTNPAINKPFPSTKLQTKDATVSTLDLLGQAQVITFLSPNFPDTSTQLAALKTSQVASTVIFPNLSPSQAYLFGIRGNYSQNFYSDPDGLLVTPLSLFTSPTHVFVNKDGIVKKITTGLLSPIDLIHNIPN